MVYKHYHANAQPFFKAHVKTAVFRKYLTIEKRLVMSSSPGFTMVSYQFFNTLSKPIQQATKPIIMWVYK